MKKLLVILLTVLLFNCGHDSKENEPENRTTPIPILETGKTEINAFIKLVKSDSIKINYTTKEELSSIYKIEVNDYYMSKKIAFEDHTIYITFTILNDVLTKVNYSSLSNDAKDFTYISKIVEENFGNEFDKQYNTIDSTESNSTKIWKDTNETIKFTSFQGLNGGYELIIE